MPVQASECECDQTSNGQFEKSDEGRHRKKDDPRWDRASIRRWLRWLSAVTSESLRLALTNNFDPAFHLEPTPLLQLLPPTLLLSDTGDSHL